MPGLRRLLPILSLALLVGLWALAADLASSRALPGPAAVLEALVREASSGALFHHLGVTLARMAAAFVIAMSVGSALGILLGRSDAADRLFGPWLTVFLNIPALVVIVLAYVWFGLTEAAAIGAVAVNKIPNATVVLREGARAIDEQYVEMARTFRMARSDVLRHVILPQLTPYFAAAARSGLALIWKIVLVVELLGRSDGVGFQINLYFQMFDVAGILAYTVAFVAVVQLLELCVLQPVESRLTRWRPVRAEA
ncbi:ABC transporter permease [Azospirillum canadense]|uniref:ABC transporter permease n=1 Tax=Azospirillum canadense TaxID=403962 RepID=UPI002226D35D|nr:ABC transporter permease [Azospirillum canadense]MCW2237821.1 NitT/TauT family transport system permease protein [Azospirillum canadense]